MSLNIINKSLVLPNGKTVTIETGKLAKQADGSIVLKCGNTMLLATVCSKKDAGEDVDFLPLSVDYQEKFGAVGRFPGGFLKRESKLSDYEILISRLVDRALRPLFPEDYHADTQVMIQLISGDTENLPDGFAAFAASAAISVSDVPFNGPISEVRVIKDATTGEYIINPSPAQIENSKLELIVAATAKDIIMVEGEADEVSELEMLEALKAAHAAIIPQIQLQIELANELGITKRTYCHEKSDDVLKEKLWSELYAKVYEAARLQEVNKNKRGENFKKIIEEWVAALPAEHGFDKFLIKKYYHDIEKEAARKLVLDERVRLDGRKLEQIRPIWSEVDYIPSAHGSSVFTRGETQSLTTVTLGTKLDEQSFDSPMNTGTSRFLLHYNFPGFSTGEVKPNRAPGRREIGHGNLAQRGLQMVLPEEADMPYTLRIVSDILESNGSSSMATVCAGTLALMDAGIKIKAPVSGIAMGLITDTNTGKYAVLSDILGDEDHLGDMDFKVVGTENGITACQMDIKIDGLSYEILEQALGQAKQGRLHILNEMKKTIAEPREDYKANAPRIVQMMIDKDFIGAVIGPGGKVIQEMQRVTNTTIVIEEVNNQGKINIYATNAKDLNDAVAKIKGIVSVPEIGEVYEAKVKTLAPYGAFVEFLPGKEGLLHISEVKWERLENMDGVLEVGEMIKVKLLDVDKKTGKFKLSRKVLLPKPEATTN
ncbi:MAG: polyribonucleotide nucleotidyltransferase [Cytophagales bacterium]